MARHHHTTHSFTPLMSLLQTIESMSPQEREERKGMIDMIHRHIDRIRNPQPPRQTAPDIEVIRNWEEARQQGLRRGYQHRREAASEPPEDDDSIIDVPEEDIEELR